MKLPGAIVANTVYAGSKLVARDVAVTLPSVTWLTGEVRAMGTQDMPIAGLFEAMEAAITKIGIDEGLLAMIRPESTSFEFRWAQDTKNEDGSSKPQGCKAFIRGVPKGIPGAGIDPGNNTENEIAISVTRYQLFVNGVEYCLLDRFNHVCRIGGTDYFGNIASML